MKYLLSFFVVFNVLYKQSLKKYIQKENFKLLWSLLENYLKIFTHHYNLESLIIISSQNKR
jgi:hypothetical protein